MLADLTWLIGQGVADRCLVQLLISVATPKSTSSVVQVCSFPTAQRETAHDYLASWPRKRPTMGRSPGGRLGPIAEETQIKGDREKLACASGEKLAKERCGIGVETGSKAGQSSRSRLHRPPPWDGDGFPASTMLSMYGKMELGNIKFQRHAEKPEGSPENDQPGDVGE